jgi:hypothetical protein
LTAAVPNPFELAARSFEPPQPRPPDPIVDAGPAILAAHLDPTNYVRRPHLDVISEAWVDIHQGQDDRLALSMPSQVGKTTTAVDWAVFWWLILHPKHRVAVATYGDSLAVVRGRAVRRLVEQYGETYGLKLDRSTWSAHDWSLTTGGGLLSVGVGSGFTGRPCDLAIVDDPHKDRPDADSRVIRLGVHNWWSAVVVPRMAPGAPIVIVQTRWHPDDLIGRVTLHEGTTDRGGRWRVISMPALCTDPKNDPLGRGMGDPLPHPGIAEGNTAALLRHWHERRSSMTPRDWSAICQCDPKPPGGALLTDDELRDSRRFDPADHVPARRSGVAVDPSGGGRDVAGVIGGYLGEDGRLWYTRDASMVGPADQWARAAATLAATIDADLIVYEANYGGDMAAAVIRTAWNALVQESAIQAGRLCPRLVPVHSRKGKLLRAEPVAQAWREDRIRTAAYLPELEAEWVSWSPASPDSPGRIDASVHLAWALLPPPGSVSQVAAPVGQMPAATVSPLGSSGVSSGVSSGFGTTGLGPLG